ncbi:MAG: hypothetical protein K6G54_01240, partial [Oscillospiraceae bacterium]|nr:hypothetical protein [Oscillospiraceae bacterium]
NHGGLTPTGEDAYCLVGFYCNDRYLGYRELRGNLAVGETTAVTFDYTALAGPQKLTAVVNDIGRNVREVNYDNNRFDRVLSGTETDFADLAVTHFTADVSDGATLSWAQDVAVRATVRNDSPTEAGAFKVLLYDNEQLVASRLVEGLAANAETEQTFSWRPESGGSHTLRLVADGPISSVLELDESNNDRELSYESLTMRYPDLTVTALESSLSGETLAPGQNILFYATVKNAGKGDALVPTRLYFYADSRYIGSAEVGAIPAGESTLVSFVWKDPALSAGTITAIADGGETLTESDESNNNGTLQFENPIRVSNSRLTITDVSTTGAARYGDAALTTVTVCNSGDRAIDRSFLVALYAGASRVGTAEVDGLEAGESSAVSIPWTAELSGSVTLRVYADAEAKLVLAERSAASTTRTLEIAAAPMLSGGADADAYCVGDTAELRVTVASSDASYLPIAADRLTATLDDAPVTMTYSETEGVYSGSVTLAAAGAHTLCITAECDGAAQTLTQTLTVADDFRVTLDNATGQSYGLGATVPVTGFVKAADGTALSGVPVTVTAVGSERLSVDATTGADGSYSASLALPEGIGGAFALRAYASYGGVEHRSERVTFYVDGVSVDVSDRLHIVQGWDALLAGYVNNLGVTAAAVGTVSVSDLPDGLSYTIEEAPGGSLAAESGAPLRIRFEAAKTLAPGDYTLRVNAGERGRNVTLTCEEAKAVARVNVIGVNESGDDALRSPRVTLSLRQGAEASAVIRLTNVGTAPITGVRAETDLPFVLLSAIDPEAVVQPVSRGYTIRDAAGALSIVVTASPNESALTGVYEGAVTIRSDDLDEELVVPLTVSVGAGLMGTTVFEVRNQDNTLLSGAEVTLIGLDEQLDPVRFDATTDAEGCVT